MSEHESDVGDVEDLESVEEDPEIESPKPKRQLAVKGPLTKEEKEVRDQLRKKANRIEAYFTHPISGPALRNRLPEVDYDIKVLYNLSEAELDDLQLQIDRAYQGLVGCTLFSTGIHYAAPFIEQALVSLPFLREKGINAHGFARALKQNDKIPLILANLDIEFAQTIGTGALGGAVMGFLDTLHGADSRNKKRKTTINFYIKSGMKGITPLMQEMWKAEAMAHGIKSTHELIQYLLAEENMYATKDAEIEARAREATGDYSQSEGAEDAADLTQAAPLSGYPRTRRPHSAAGHRLDEESKEPPGS